MKLNKKIVTGMMAFLFGLSGIVTTNLSYASDNNSTSLTSFGAYKGKDYADAAARNLRIDGSSKPHNLFKFADGWGYYVGDYVSSSAYKSYETLNEAWNDAYEALKKNPNADTCMLSELAGEISYSLLKIDFKNSVGAYKTKSEAQAAGEKALKENPALYNLKVYRVDRNSNLYSYIFDVDSAKLNNYKGEEADPIEVKRKEVIESLKNLPALTDKERAYYEDQLKRIPPFGKSVFDGVYEEAKRLNDKNVKNNGEVKSQNNKNTKEKLEEAIKNSKKTIENAEFVIKKYPNTLKGVIPEVKALIAKSKALIKEAESRLAKYN